MSTTTALVVSLVLLVANGFFVAAEFAIVAAKRHRLEERAEEGSRAARAAVDASRELSLMLAGAQLGITLCTLALGALAKPAVAYLLEPVIAATAQRALAAALDDIGSCAFRADLASARHETQYTRLFRS